MRTGIVHQIEEKLDCLVLLPYKKAYNAIRSDVANATSNLKYAASLIK